MIRLIDARTTLPQHATQRWARRTAPITVFCIHHSVTPATATPEAIARGHMRRKSRPPGILYHYLIAADGTIWWVNEDALLTWHGHDWNVGLGVCLIGDFTTAQPTEAQLAAARWLYAEKQREYGPLRLVGHGEALRASTECPGRTWEQWRDQIVTERTSAMPTSGVSMQSHIVGWHMGNVREATDVDWQILQAVPPSSLCFLSRERFARAGGGRVPDLERVLAINPRCHMHVRPYLDPNTLGDRERPNYGAPIDRYIDDCRATMDELSSHIPAGQKHLRIYNEQNMPRWSQWEGFGERLTDMQRFNEVWLRTYDALKRHDPSWLIGWTPLTPGNRDVWFAGDPTGHYYLHGPAGCVGNPTAEQIAEAIRTGPCRESLMRADEFCAHVYIHEAADAFQAPWWGLRFTRYQRYFPKPMDIWITECGFPSRPHFHSWAGLALVGWYDQLRSHPAVKGTCQWMLGNWQGEAMWETDGRPRAEVQVLADYIRRPAPVRPIPAPAPIPSPAPSPTIPAAITAAGVSYRNAPNAAQMFSSPREMGIAAPRHSLRLFLVLHSTDGPRDAAFNWWANPANAARSSAHDLIDRDGVVWRCVPYNRTAHHAGSTSARMQGVPLGSTANVSNTNHASIGMELESGKAPAPAGYTERQLEAAVRHIAAIARELGIPRERWVTHTQVDPIRKPTCPRDLDVAAFWQRVERVLDPTAIDEAALGAWMGQHVLRVNPTTAFSVYARERAWEPRSDEHDWQGVRAQVWAGVNGKSYVVWARIGDWANVRHFET